MAQIKHYKARRPFKLDCGHLVNAGESFAVTKVFTCEADVTRIAIPKVERRPASYTAYPPMQS